MNDELKAAGAAMASLKAAFDMTKALLDVKGAVEVQGKVFELQRVILAAQQDTFTAQEAQSTLLKRVRDLEKEVADLETWESEQERYELAQVTPSVLAYRLKPEAQGTEPQHWLCPNCFARHHKSILQQETLSYGRVVVLLCHNCGAELLIHGLRHGETQRRAPRNAR